MKKRALAILLIFALAMALLPANALAHTVEVSATRIIDSGYCGAEGDGTNLMWVLADNGVLTISGVGEMVDFLYDQAPWLPDYWNSINKIVIEEGVTSIGMSAFLSCQVTEVSFPSTLKSIGFTAFACCNNLQSITLPEGLEFIDEFAFYNCPQLQSFTFPTTLESIPGAIFENDIALRAIIIPVSVKSISPGAFRESYLESVAIPHGITEISDSLFSNCKYLTSVTIPSTVTDIWLNAFAGCDNLETVYFGGTQEQWESIVIHSNNDPLLRAKVHYNCKVPGDDLVPGGPSEDPGTSGGTGSNESDESTGYTGFGKLNAYNYKKTAVIDGVTYALSSQYRRPPEELTLAGDYSDDYIYALYRLDKAGEITDLLPISGVACTLEGWDAENGIVDTNLESIAEFSPLRLEPGDYKVSDLAKNFPSARIQGWVGEKLLVYTDCQEIYKAIHVTEGEGVINSFDRSRGQVSIDGKTYSAANYEDLWNTLALSVSEKRPYLLYDDVLVSVAPYRSYLALDMNNATRSYYVGDEVRLFVYDCTEFDDDTVSYRTPKGLNVSLSGSPALALKQRTEYNGFEELIFSARMEGVALLTLSSTVNSDPVSIPITVTTDEHRSCRADHLTVYTYDSIINKDQFSAHINGMYVTDFYYTKESDSSFIFNFKVYNETYAPGVVEVYNENGELFDFEVISKFSEQTSLKDVWDSAGNLVHDFFAGDLLSFRDSSGSAETDISVKVPAGGHIRITNSCSESSLCLFTNLIDFVITGAAMIKGAKEFNTDATEVLPKEALLPLLDSKYGIGAMDKMKKSVLDEFKKTEKKSSTQAVLGLAYSCIDKLKDVYQIDVISLIYNGLKNYGFKALADFFTEAGGPYGQAINGFFLIEKAINLMRQKQQLDRNLEFNAYWEVYTPEDRTMVDVTPSSSTESETEVQPENPGEQTVAQPENSGEQTVAQPETPGEQTVVQPEASVEKNTASVTLDEAAGNEIVAAAVKNENSEAVVAPKVAEDANRVEVHLAGQTIKDLASKTDANLRIETALASVNVPAQVLDTLNPNSTFNVSVDKDKDTLFLEVLVDGKAVKDLSGEIRLEIPIANCKPSTVAILVKEDGSREVIRTALPDVENKQVIVFVDGSAKLLLTDNHKNISDVPATAWYAEHVDFASSHELMNGDNAGKFRPNDFATRGAIAALLYNLEHNPKAGNPIFPDTTAADWFTDAVTWAASNGVVSGYGNGTFGANDNITREQMACILYNYATYKGMVTVYIPDFEGYTDTNSISSWAETAMGWAVSKGLIKGSNGKLNPGGTASRAEISALLRNFCIMMAE